MTKKINIKYKTMKILQTIAGLNVLSGGPSKSTYQLVKGMNDLKGNVDLLSVQQKNPQGSTYNDSWIHLMENDYKTPFKISNNLKNYLEKNEYDLYNTNGLWLYCNHITAKIARSKNKPYILTPRGMLYPEALKRSKYIKWITRKLFFNQDILNSTCIHATCEDEAKYIREFGYKGPIAIIGNVVEMPEFAPIATSKPQGKKIIGFLGRLHPRKGAEKIINAIAQAPQKVKDNIIYQIMGKGIPEYENFLHKEVERLGLQDIVKFEGFVQGAEKYKKLRDLSALFVPSDFENFGMIIPEALISGTPVFASLGTPWESLNQTNCGWWMERSIENIVEILNKIVEMSEAEILAMGARGRKLIEDNFSSNIIAQKTIDLYKWILGENDKPNYVQN